MEMNSIEILRLSKTIHSTVLLTIIGKVSLKVVIFALQAFFLWKATTCFYVHKCLCISDRFLSPEFIPPRQRTNPFKFYVERRDMLQRRQVLNIPEFYAGQ